VGAAYTCKRDKSLHAFDKFTQVKTTWIQLG
jgi:hypothetical protein